VKNGNSLRRSHHLGDRPHSARVQHDVESRREDAEKTLYVLPQSLLKTVERALLDSLRVGERGNEDREAGIGCVHQVIKQSSGITVHSEQKLTGRPLPVITSIYIGDWYRTLISLRLPGLPAKMW